MRQGKTWRRDTPRTPPEQRKPPRPHQADNAGKPARQTGRFIKRERIGPPQCPIMDRWTVLSTRPLKILVHHFMPDARDVDPHDHPRSFFTFILRGFYLDVSHDGEVEAMRPGRLRFRKAEHAHTTLVGPTGCWTIVVMGPPKRDWGFWRNGKWWPFHKYEERFGMGFRCEDRD